MLKKVSLKILQKWRRQISVPCSHVVVRVCAKEVALSYIIFKHSNLNVIMREDTDIIPFRAFSTLALTTIHFT